MFRNAHAEKAAYQEHWIQNAAHLEAQDCYKWMADQLASVRPRKILDIGCGTGEGLSALRSAFGCTIVGMDENC